MADPGNPLVCVSACRMVIGEGSAAAVRKPGT